MGYPLLHQGTPRAPHTAPSRATGRLNIHVQAVRGKIQRSTDHHRQNPPHVARHGCPGQKYRARGSLSSARWAGLGSGMGGNRRIRQVRPKPHPNRSPHRESEPSLGKVVETYNPIGKQSMGKKGIAAGVLGGMLQRIPADHMQTLAKLLEGETRALGGVYEKHN